MGKVERTTEREKGREKRVKEEEVLFLCGKGLVAGGIQGWPL